MLVQEVVEWFLLGHWMLDGFAVEDGRELELDEMERVLRHHDFSDLLACNTQRIKYRHCFDGLS
jgi:hypothetical protein